MEHTTQQHHGRWFHADGRLDGHVWRPAYAILPGDPDGHGSTLLGGGNSVIGDETFASREQARELAAQQARVAIDSGA